MTELAWYLSPNEAAGTLLLVAVDSVPTGAGMYPCRVVGAVSPMETKAAEDDAVRIARALAEVGVPANLLGHAYLRTALRLVMGDGSLRRCMTRCLYPRVAGEHGTTAQGVERAIRHAIGVTWARTGGEGYRRTLGRLASYVGEKPTNAEFIAQLSETLQGEGPK